jgi:hypothetical protein
MSELSGVSNLTIFQGLSTGSRKAVDNPAPLRAKLRRDQDRSRHSLILVEID